MGYDGHSSLQASIVHLRQVPRLLEDGVSWRTPAVWQAVARHGKLQFLICCGRLVPMVGS